MGTTQANRTRKQFSTTIDPEIIQLVDNYRDVTRVSRSQIVQLALEQFFNVTPKSGDQDHVINGIGRNEHGNVESPR